MNTTCSGGQTNPSAGGSPGLGGQGMLSLKKFRASGLPSFRLL